MSQKFPLQTRRGTLANKLSTLKRQTHRRILMSIDLHTTHSHHLSVGSLKPEDLQTKALLRKQSRTQLPTHDQYSSEHLADLLKQLRVCSSLSFITLPQLIGKQVRLPTPLRPSGRKTLIFDLDETLVYCSNRTTETILSVQCRPGLFQCLKAAKKLFEVVVFTAATKEYADQVLDQIDPERSLIEHRLYRHHCVEAHGHYIKDLRVLQNRSLDHIAIVDNSCVSFCSQLDNGIPIQSWTGQSEDRDLFNLTEYLKRLAVADIRETNRETFKLSRLQLAVNVLSKT